MESKFLLTLNRYYSDKIRGTRFYCKFYAQATSFSFELHDSTKTCFTKNSVCYESDVYSFWINNKKTQMKILGEIRGKAMELELTRKAMERSLKVHSKKTMIN